MLRNSHRSFFHTPRVLEMPSFGLDITDGSIKFVELLSTSDGIKVGKYGEKNIPPGVIDGGRIVDSKKFEDILFSLKKEHGLNIARVSILTNQTYFYRLNVELKDIENIDEVIELSVSENTHLLSEEVVYDFETLGEHEDVVELMVTVVPQSVVEEYLIAFQNCEIIVSSFEPEATALARAVVPRDSSFAHMLVDFGEFRTTISIVAKGIVIFSSALALGGNMLESMIQESFQVEFDVAKRMKKEFGLSRNTPDQKVSNVLQDGAVLLRDEISRCMTHYNTEVSDGSDESIIKSIVLAGGDSNLIGLSDYLSASLKTQTLLANPWTNIIDTDMSIPSIGFKQAHSLSMAFGLALRDFYEEGIDLLPKIQKKKLKRYFYSKFVVVLFLMLAFCMLIATLAIMPAYFTTHRSITQLKQSIENGSDTTLLESLRDEYATAKLLDREMRIIESSNENKFLVSKQVVNEIVSKRISGIKITGISYGDTGTNGKNVVLYGSADSRDSLYKYTQELKQDENFQSVDVPISDFAESSDLKFTINIIYK